MAQREKNKEQKLLDLLYSVLNHPQHGKQIIAIAKKLNLIEKDIVEGFLYYNLNVEYPEKNELYRPLSIRFALHIHNLIENSWHTERQATVIEFLKLANPVKIADIGFGTPSQYVKELVLNQNKMHATLLDVYDSAFIFSRELLNDWDTQWEDKISFKKMDMNTLEYVGDFDLYLMQDSVEHTFDPAAYLKKHVQLSPKNAKFIISLPIGPIYPCHYMEWINDKEAVDWLTQCGLKIDRKKLVYTNPSVDLFAEQLASDYHDLYVLCSKR